MELDLGGPHLDRLLTMNLQDLPRPPTKEYANYIRNVALHLHIHRPLDCLSLSFQPLRACTAPVLADDTTLQFLRRLPHPGKFELGV